MELNDKRIEVAKLRDDSSKDVQKLTDKVAQAKQQNDEIATPRGFESYVRTTYPVVKEGGEGVIVVYDDEKSPVSQVRSDMNVWERLLVFWNNFGKK
jgi:hypothetical protein